MNDHTNLETQILEAFHRLRSKTRVAQALDIEMSTVMSVIGDRRARQGGGREERFEGLGRPKLQKYIVARKPVTRPWANTDPAITKARQDFEDGLVTLSTGRDGDWLILYAIPLKNLRPRPNYFRVGVYQ